MRLRQMPRRSTTRKPAGARSAGYGLILLLGLAGLSCKGSSRDAVIAVNVFSASGRCLDSAGAGLAGVQLALATLSATTTADGSFAFANLKPGFSAQLVPASPGITFSPAQRGVRIAKADVTQLDFTGFAIARASHTLPATHAAGEPVVFYLRALDAQDQVLSGYSSGPGELTSTPPGMVVLQQPRFNGGAAVCVVRFDGEGSFSVALRGVCAALDGELGAVQITPGTPAQDVFRVEKWQGGAEAALSLTFDDGTQDQWTRGLPLWQEYGFHVTLGIVADRFLSHPERLPQLQQAFDAGHELANHSATHPDLTTRSLAEAQQEVQQCQDLLLQNVQGLNRIYTFAYPYETYNGDLIAMLQDMGFLFARSGPQDLGDVTPLNDALNPPDYHLYAWVNLSALPFSFWDNSTDNVLAAGGWMIEECHGIGTVGEPGVGWNARPESEFRAHYDHIKSFGARLWVAPLGVAGRYATERNFAQVSLIASGAQRIDFAVTDTLDDAVYNVPLTLSCAMPPGWSNLRIEQGAAAITFTENAQGRVLFNIVPSSGAASLVNVP